MSISSRIGRPDLLPDFALARPAQASHIWPGTIQENAVIVVAGATGSLGSKIVHALLEQGESVRALVRHGSNFETLERAGASIAMGNLKDPESLQRAVRDVDAIISTASASGRSDDTVENVDGRGNRNLIDAAREAGVRHVVLVSTIGATPQSDVPIFRAKGEAEEHLRTSGIDFTILQPTPFMNVWFGMLIEMPISSGQPVTLVGESRHRHSFIAERDVASFAIAAVRHSAARNVTLVLGGPGAITFRDVVQAYEDALNRTIPVRSAAPGDPIPGVPEPVWGIAAALETFDSVVPMEDLARLYGVSLTSARDFARMSPLAKSP
jgi:NADH dehydrogenase